MFDVSMQEAATNTFGGGGDCGNHHHHHHHHRHHHQPQQRQRKAWVVTTTHILPWTVEAVVQKHAPTIIVTGVPCPDGQLVRAWAHDRVVLPVLFATCDEQLGCSVPEISALFALDCKLESELDGLPVHGRGIVV